MANCIETGQGAVQTLQLRLMAYFMVMVHKRVQVVDFANVCLNIMKNSPGSVLL